VAGHVKAKALTAAGWIVVIGGSLVTLAFAPMLVVAVPVYLGYLLMRRGRKHAVERGETALLNDTRAPVLYLRSFEDEAAEASILHRFTRVARPERTQLASTVANNGLQEQDALGCVFRKIGPYVALGKPGENLPELGSRKIYVPNDAWQQQVRSLVARSRLIVFRAGRTEGLRWELHELVKTTSPRNVLLLLPADEEAYASFVEWANRVMPQAFPPDYPSSRVVVFDEDWSPRYLAPGRSLADTLAPFFERNGLVVRESFWERTLEHNGLRW
jgi:hypothetical protein